MLYVLRLSDGDCVVVLASDEQEARRATNDLDPDNPTEIVSVRQLEGFALRLSPTEEASLEISGWNDATLDSILSREYPLLEEAYRRANAERFDQSQDPKQPALSRLRSQFERNTEAIRKALELELHKFRRPIRVSAKAGRGNQ
jgi:hypothetical protein